MSLRAALVMALLAVASDASAIELFRDAERSLELTGSVRELVTVTRGTSGSTFASRFARSGPACALPAAFPDCPAFEVVGDRDVFESLTRARFEIEGHWSDRLWARVTYDHELRFGILDRLGDALGPASTDTFLGAEDEIHWLGLKDDRNHRRWSHRLYRGYVRYEGESFQFTVGRQRIPWGVGRLWNPIDRFNAIPPLAVESDQSPGIDAIEARWILSGFSYFQAVYAPTTRSDDARYAIRWQGVVRDVDVSVMAGVFEEAHTIGGDLSGNLGDAAWRLEAVWTNPEREIWPVTDARAAEPDRFWQIVVSLDTNFDLGSGVYALVEHLYDGNALGFGEGRAGNLLPFFGRDDTGTTVVPAGSDPFGGSGVASFGRHTTGFQVGYDLTSVLRGDLLVLHDWNGESDAIFATLSFTGFNSVELQGGVQLFRGPRRSAFGDREPLVFLLTEWYF